MSGRQFDYRDVSLSDGYLDQFGRIKSRHKTGLTAVEQRRLKTAIERARHLALLPLPMKMDEGRASS